MGENEKRVSEHFPPRVRDMLIEAAARLTERERLDAIAMAHAYAVAMYPELFKRGA